MEGGTQGDGLLGENRTRRLSWNGLYHKLSSHEHDNRVFYTSMSRDLLFNWNEERQEVATQPRQGFPLGARLGAAWHA